MMQPVIIVDLLNIFIRCYEAYPQMSQLNGDQIGGCIGFLKSIAKIARDQQPSRIYIAWEGGGSSRRRALYSEYKLSRKPAKLNRFYEDDIPDTEENRKHQLLTLLKISKCLPVCNLYVSDAEGDDLAAYLCKGPLRDQQKIIWSGDKDFYQLFDKDTWAYSPHKKRMITTRDVFEEFRVTSNNFAIAKALCGDTSDNVPGIKGLGFKTCAKRFPMLGLEQDILLQDVIAYAWAHRTESKVYQEVCDNEAIVKRNYHLVYLDGSMVPVQQQAIVDEKILNYVPKADRIGLIGLLKKEGVGDFDVLTFFQAFDTVMLSK